MPRLRAFKVFAAQTEVVFRFGPIRRSFDCARRDVAAPRRGVLRCARPAPGWNFRAQRSRLVNSVSTLERANCRVDTIVRTKARGVVRNPALSAPTSDDKACWTNVKVGKSTGVVRAVAVIVLLQ